MRYTNTKFLKNIWELGSSRREDFLWTDRQADRRTESKPTFPSNETGRGLKKGIVYIIYLHTTDDVSARQL